MEIGTCSYCYRPVGLKHGRIVRHGNKYYESDLTGLCAALPGIKGKKRFETKGPCPGSFTKPYNHDLLSREEFARKFNSAEK